MEIERRERDPDTGEIAPSEASLIGEGFGDVFGKQAKLPKNLQQKQQKNLLRKELKKLGEKTGQLVGEKIYEKFSTKPSPASEAPSPATEDRPPEIKGKEIGKMLAASSPPVAPEKNKFQKINNVYADLL